MFHESYLFNPEGADSPLEKPVFKRLPAVLTNLVLVVPRSLSLHLRINCVGVSRLQLAAFARLQVQAAAPFVSYGSCVIRQGDWLHAWVWDAAIETAFAAKLGGNRRFSTLSHSLFSMPVADGVTWLGLPDSRGVEAQLWSNKQLVDSIYLDNSLDSTGWVDLCAQTPELEASGWPEKLVFPDVTQIALAHQPHWGRNLTPRKQHRAIVNWAYLVTATLVLTTAVLAGWGAWLFGQKESYQQAIDQGFEFQDRRIAEMEPIQKARSATQQILVWVNAASELAPSPGTNEILVELAAIITRQGLVVRELEINLPTLQATLVATSGREPRLTAVLGAIESHTWFEDARFVDVSGGSGFKFTWRMRPTASAKLKQSQP